MHITKKNLIIPMMIAVGFLQMSAMESPEWRAEEIRLDQLRRQQTQQTQQQLQPLNQALVNQFEALQSLQQKQQRKRLKPGQLQTLQNLEQQFQKLSSQQLQQLRQQVQQKQNKNEQKKLKKQQKAQKKLNKSQNQPNLQQNNQQKQPHPFDVYAHQPQQSFPSMQSSQLQQSQLKAPKQTQQPKQWQLSQAPQNKLVTREVAMKQVLLDERDNDMQRLEEHITSQFHQPMQLLEEVERLQIPIDLYLLEPSQELENKAKNMQNNPNVLTANQQTEIDKLQQQRLEDLHQELTLKQIQHQQPFQQAKSTEEQEREKQSNKLQRQHDQYEQFQQQVSQNPSKQTHQPLQPFPSVQPQLQQPINSEQTTEEQQECSICLEAQDEKNICSIPCARKHDDPICKSCLAEIKKRTNRCPMCRQELLK